MEWIGVEWRCFCARLLSMTWLLLYLKGQARWDGRGSYLLNSDEMESRSFKFRFDLRRPLRSFLRLSLALLLFDYTRSFVAVVLLLPACFFLNLLHHLSYFSHNLPREVVSEHSHVSRWAFRDQKYCVSETIRCLSYTSSEALKP